MKSGGGEKPAVQPFLGLEPSIGLPLAACSTSRPLLETQPGKGREPEARDPFPEAWRSRKTPLMRAAWAGRIPYHPRPEEKPLPRMRLAGIERDSDLRVVIGCALRVL